ncbi:serine/threonine phosphoprotein phosphatase [Deinococcus proteolyticus MRP]|uniref:Serine/threonine phosphoprotein phosphatase n=1 Tax=Deinococcus proteolyticus (strain ATCC 35074 / DSM 20540 / JCM 6276 / NBRC 101906 / NCIMB 13154 / VKM Ac-1939 / CCM 2703 / MRP) TaxID=693977 RepID=F0RJQ0_DEIPM|nr:MULTISPECIES: PP2C family serine/threonine-protein phosphatase [Deinococcus]ADY26620.1 serine/threonine phosphoprotein phosphatase [Deinococcus proteolyticus MRP]MCY1702745.1 PP2C family serine/threonine-protein phosphatase [Deinococcus sp. SL84]
MSNWRYISASEIGTGHLATAQPCQDNHKVALIPTGSDEDLLLLVAADGAGSADLSDKGSALVCEAAVTWLIKNLSSGEMDFSELNGSQLMTELVNILEGYLSDHHPDSSQRDLACTLNVAAILPTKAWFLQVGDGAIVVQTADEKLKTVFWPDNGEYANQTFFVTDVPEDHVHVRVIEGEILRISMMTDGLTSLALLMQTQSVHAPFFNAMFGGVEKLGHSKGEDWERLEQGLRQFLNSPAVNSRTSDDKTLILASRLPLTPIPAEAKEENDPV